ncbi:MAG TPA: sugar transferase [Saprospiraceae bacterium]|nr:sugar transferase [Saprospiraceae bacterium]
MNNINRERAGTLSKVLMVGFPIPADSFIEHHELIEKEGRDILEFHHPLECLSFLKSQGAADVFAIFIDLPTIERDDFRFLQALTKNAELEAIPVIAIAPGWVTIDRKDLMLKGLDDCYVEPVDWLKLRARVDFLNTFKIHKNIEYRFSATEYKIPVGKRIFDIVFSLVALTFLFIPFVIIAIIIKLTSKGPVFYLSDRAGTGYKIFKFIKFRSMAQGADQKIKDLAHLNNYDDDKEAVFVKLKNDPRVTKIGKIIRKGSIDELPQFINVLKGDMSIVGNRPLPLYEAEQLTKDEWAARFIAPAGLTGLWQTAPGGKVNVSNEDRISLDIEYAQNSSFWTDLKIIAKTLPAMIQKGE